jgi:hypothetical protein
MKKSLYLLLACGSLALTGCANLNTPKYSFSPENVQALKDAGNAKVRLGEFRAATPETETADIGMRGARLSSPYGSFSSYLREALQQEFAEAGRIAPDAKTEISGELVKHLFNANGLSVGEGELAARITVKRDGLATFDKQVAAKTTWESSFAGAVALPKAVTEYPKLVREFVRSLFQDPDFINATK